MGSLEAVVKALRSMEVPAVEIAVLHSGLGGVSKFDVFLAETGSRLIVGFEVDVLPGIEKFLLSHGVEVRLYSVIYDLISDIREIAGSLTLPSEQERTLGSARVIALFKSSRRGIIAGCEVEEGVLGVGERFRVISVMGPVYAGTLDSLHEADRSIQKAVKGQKVGVKIRDFNKVHVGDFVETYRPEPQKARAWVPRADVIRR
jgi:translation initiation factor IF-2